MRFIKFLHHAILELFVTFISRSPQNFRKVTRLKIAGHDVLLKDWQTPQLQQSMNGMSCSDVSKSMPPSRVEQRVPKSHVTRYQPNVCNLPITQNFERIFQGFIIRIRPMSMRGLSVCRKSQKVGGKNFKAWYQVKQEFCRAYHRHASCQVAYTIAY